MKYKNLKPALRLAEDLIYCWNALDQATEAEREIQLRLEYDEICAELDLLFESRYDVVEFVHDVRARLNSAESRGREQAHKEIRGY